MSILTAFEKLTRKRIGIKDYSGEDVVCEYDHELIAKRGDKRIHHYCHKNDVNCQSSKGKSEFHLYWQSRIKPENLEITMENHRADIKINELVIEIQHSVMKKEIIKEREDFYKNLVWIFDVVKHDFIIINKQKDLILFKLTRGSEYFLKAKKKTYLDMDHQGLLEVIKKKGNLILTRKRQLKWIDENLFKGEVLDVRDMRSDKTMYDCSKICTEEEIKTFIKLNF